jgi:hypothetical protein
MSELDRWQRERYEAAAAAIRENLVRLVRAEAAALPDHYCFLHRTEAECRAEEIGRREWIEGVKRRLGLITADDR